MAKNNVRAVIITITAAVNATICHGVCPKFVPVSLVVEEVLKKSIDIKPPNASPGAVILTTINWQNNHCK
jgi:hypothetical protein